MYSKIFNNKSKMITLLLTFCYTIAFSLANDIGKELYPISWQENEHAFFPQETEDVENNIERMEKIAASAEKIRREGILPIEDVEESYSRMVEILEDITEQLNNPLNIYKFLNTNGVDRIITPLIGIHYEPLKTQLLILIKTMFNVAPTTTKALIPVSVIDKLLDVFEHDDNLALKTHALDIMHIWLPNNPKLQARVMKLKGLEFFYQQFSKLDSTVIHTMLDLFKKILQEHIKVLDNKSHRNKDDYENTKLYQTVGLIERMSTPQVCNGLFNILETLLKFTNNDDDEIPPITFELLKYIQPFCLKLYKGKDGAIKLFDVLNNYVADPTKIELMQTLGLNTTEMKMLVESFAKNIKENIRDEF